MNTKRLPKWRKWKKVNQAKVWECVALSLNIEPSLVNQNTEPYNRTLIFEESDEFKDRLDIAERNLSPPGFIESGEDLRNYYVPLANFAAWMTSIGLDIPNELTSLVRDKLAQVDKSLTSSPASPDTVLASSEYWLQLTALANESIKKYPSWAKGRKKIQKSGNLDDWLRKTIGADSRESEILKKILSDLFQELR